MPNYNHSEVISLSFYLFKYCTIVAASSNHDFYYEGYLKPLSFFIPKREVPVKKHEPIVGFLARVNCLSTESYRRTLGSAWYKQNNTHLIKVP